MEAGLFGFADEPLTGLYTSANDGDVRPLRVDLIWHHEQRRVEEQITRTVDFILIPDTLRQLLA
ncbi:hypothetical protein BHS04_09335 [Myxococcus xanthus]|nr:hypothetical protein BHS04_09335 [Myxococcus xanthus]